MLPTVSTHFLPIGEDGKEMNRTSGLRSESAHDLCTLSSKLTTARRVTHSACCLKELELG